MEKRAKKIVELLFPSQWSGARAGGLWACALLVLLWFDVEWALAGSFTCFSTVTLWVNTLLLSFLMTACYGWWKTQATIITVFAVWLECNLLYSRTYFTAIPASSYLLAGNLVDFTASVADSLRPLDFGFVIVVAAAWIMALKKKKPAVRRGTVWGAPLLLFVISATMVVSEGGYVGVWEKLSNHKYYASRVPMYTVAGWLTYDILRTSTPLTDEEKVFAQTWLAEHSTLFPPTPTGRHYDSVVLVYVESLETWPIGMNLEGKAITPNIDAMLADTTTFYAPNIVTQVGAGRSIDAQRLVNAGRMPLVGKVWSIEQPSTALPSVTRAFLEADTSALNYYVGADRVATWNQGAASRALGFTNILMSESWEEGELIGHPRPRLGDVALVDQLTAKMAEGEIWPVGTHAFLQVITLSNHHPWDIPVSLDSLRLVTPNLEPVTARYLTAVNYTDRALGRLVRYLKTRPDYERTLVVITGDHEGLAQLRANATRRHGFVSPEQLVPLIVLNSPTPGVFDGYAGQIDIYPTLLDLLSFDTYPWRGMGVSLLSPSHPRSAVTPTGKIYGDTTGVAPTLTRHLLLLPKADDILSRSQQD